MSAKYFLDVGCGFIPGRSIVNVFGNAINIQSVDIPCTLWPSKVLYDFPTAGETWWVRSTSANDTLTGTGAKTISINTLDDNYVPIPLIVNLTGITPTILPTGATNFRSNGMTVIDSGSLHTNDGDIILERAGGAGPIRAIIQAKKGMAVAFIYTVPAGHNLWVPNFLFNMAKFGSGDVTFQQEFHVTLENGTSLVSSTASRIQGSSEITVPTGFVIKEKNTIEIRITKISSDGLDINIQLTGILTNLAAASVVQRLPTAWTEY